ncbi:MAG TPA: response regulator [Candidatus Sulfotelmatobacter sp.]|nr:response regulator [Candidatus Sulfotelmatobacter sp.]
MAFVCPYCMSNQPPLEYREGGKVRLSCKNCGYPVEAATLAGTDGGGRRPRILCIDDDRLLLGLFTSMLELHDFEPLTAQDGPSAIEIATRERPDLVLLDVMMPGMSGFDVCRKLRSVPALQKTPIIMFTALSDSRVEPKALAAGATMAIQKPFDPKKLIDVLRAALKQDPGSASPA